MKKLFLAGGLFLCVAAFAQSYRIDSFVIAGGGGTSTNGNFSLTGTIGQIDAGKLSGGTYSIDGGFLSGIYLVQTAGAPRLSISQTGANATVSWTADSSAGFNLEQSSNLSVPGSWGSSALTFTTNGNQISVTVPASTGVRFYRLHKP